MRVLLVEDEMNVGHKLFCALKGADYKVDWVRCDKSGSTAIECSNYAAVLLNPGVAGNGGMKLLKASRAAGNRVPVLLLTENDDLDTRIRGLDIGADDCLAKPIHIREVLARIRAVMRRAAGYATSRIGDDLLSIDLDSRTLFLKGTEHSLSAREFVLMHALLERPGSILSRSQLEDRLYGWGKEVESNTLDVLIHVMRKKFGQTLIYNVRGIGWTVTSKGSSSRAHRTASPGVRRATR